MPYMDEDVRARLAELLEEIETSTFRETRWGRRGYSERDVDEFLDYLVDVLFHLLRGAEHAVPTTQAAAVELQALEVEAPQETAVLVVEDGEATEPGGAGAPEPASGPDEVVVDTVVAGGTGVDPDRSVVHAVDGADSDSAAVDATQPPPPPWVRPG